MKKTYIFTESSIYYLKEILNSLEDNSNIVILCNAIQKVINENIKKGETIRQIVENNTRFNFEIFTYNSIYSNGECLSLILSSIKRKYTQSELFLVTSDMHEALIAIYLDVKVFSTYQTSVTIDKKENSSNYTKNICLDTSYLSNMTDFSIFEDASITKHLLFFVLQELVNIKNKNIFFKIVNYINNKEKYNILINKDFMIPYLSDIITNPDLYSLLYILNQPDSKNFTLLTCDLQLIIEAKLKGINIGDLIEVNYNKDIEIVNNSTNEKFSNLTLEIVKLENNYYIYANVATKVFKDLVTQKPRQIKKFNNIKYIPVQINDYIKFPDETVYQLTSFTDRQNLREVRL